MKKLMMIFFILGSISFAAETTTAVAPAPAPVNMGQSLVSVMMPTSVSTSTHPTTQAPMDVVSGVVTTAYGAK